MTWLKQTTAAEIAVGPFVSSSDGFTVQTGLSIVQADVRLKKGAADWVQKNETTSAVHEENGWYRVLLDTTDTGAAGPVILAVTKSGALPVWHELTVLPAAVYDSLVSDTGRGLRSLQSLYATTVASATASTVTLTNSITISGSFWNGAIAWIISGAGAGQSRSVVSSTAFALTVEPDWVTTPGAGAVIAILPAGRVDVGMFEGSTDTAGSIADAVLDESVGGGLTARQALARITSGKAVIVAPVAISEDLYLVRGDAYTLGLNRALEWTDAGADLRWPTLHSEVVITLEIGDGDLVVIGSVVAGGSGDKRVRAEPLSSQTTLLDAGTYDFRVVATYTGTGSGTSGIGEESRVTLVSGVCTVTDRED